jgi:hypothetical protein
MNSNKSKNENKEVILSIKYRNHDLLTLLLSLSKKDVT